MSKKSPDAPLGWQTYRLGDITTRVVQRNIVGNNNVLTISAMNGLVSQDEYFQRRVASVDTRQYFLLEHGDFAYNKSYSAGYPAGVTRRLVRYGNGIVSPLYICFRPKTELIEPSFLESYFEAGLLDGKILDIAKEGARNHGLLNVRVEDYFNLELTIPSPFEQRRITEILDTVDENLRTLDRIIQKENVIQHGLSDSFLPASTFESLPSGWRLSTVEEITSGSPVCYGIVQAGPYDPDGVPVVMIRDLRSLDWGSLHRASSRIESRWLVFFVR
ncbi:hypothetical protein [Nocardia africana]|uniref:Type I restriction modification DNA specificity domain-containing protein n=1 Tax=Nocardia africana TaxID=134964 RepID=A0ABW6NVP5_9NOCA